MNESVVPAGARVRGTAEPDRRLLSLRGITKRFGDVVANDDVDLDFNGGEVHGILGENGAGKSTLMKIIYGFYQPDSGSLAIQGSEIHVRSPRENRRLGIGMVFQNFTLISAMTVAENIGLFWPDQGALLDRRALATRITAVSERYGFEVDPDARVADLSMGQRQKVELIKLIMANAQVLICDEPTSVLAPHEVDGLFTVFRELKRDGYSVIFITHKLGEVLEISDAITVLRHGAVVGTVEPKDVTPADLISMMIGEAHPESSKVDDREAPEHRELTALEFRDVWTGKKYEEAGLRGVSFRIDGGEIVGVAGVSGSGQEEIAEALLGLRPKRSGETYLLGRNVAGWPVSKILDLGFSYVPEDPAQMAIVASMRVEENLVLGEVHKHGSGAWLDWGRIRAWMSSILGAFPIDLPRHHLTAGQLSGGNLQRVVLARELSRTPRVLIACYPTRGLDVKTAEMTRSLLVSARKQGTAVLLISEDLDELFALSDRLFVMYEGAIVHESSPRQTTPREVGLVMTGHGVE